MNGLILNVREDGKIPTRPSSSLDRRDKELRLSGAFRLVASCL